MPILRVLSIRCHEQEDWTGDDDPYIRINGIDFWGPKSMDTGQTRIINKSHSFSHRAIIKLYEQDDVDPDDYLGEQIVTRNHIGRGEIELPFKEDDANYSIWVEVLDDKKQSADAIRALSNQK